MSKPLKILVIGVPATVCDLLREQGHIVEVASTCEADLVLGPICCRWVPGMEAHLPALIKGVRALKYPKEKK